MLRPLFRSCVRVEKTHIVRSTPYCTGCRKGGQLKLADFGQSILLPLAADVNTICENELTAKIEILHLGRVLYSFAVWEVQKCYFLHPSNLHWPNPETLRGIDGNFGGSIIGKCWTGEYVSMHALDEETHALLRGLNS